MGQPKAAIILLITWLFPFGSLWTVVISKAYFMRHELGFTEATTTRIMHTTTALKYILAIFSAILADTRWGKYKTLVTIVSLTNALVHPFAVVSALPFLDTNIRIYNFLISTFFEVFVRTYVVLLLPFISEQFILPEQQTDLRKFYFIYFMSTNILQFNILLAGPMIINHVSCFDRPCFIIPWGYDYAATLLFLIVLISCKKYFRVIVPTRSVVVEAVGCMSYALYIKSRSNEKKSHFIDYAESKYGEETREDVKRLLKVAVFFIPIIGYYNCSWQMMSKWNFQAGRMDGDIGFYRILPSQTIALHPVLIVVFVPFLETLVLPQLAKVKILYTSLQRLGFAWCLLMTAYFCAGMVQLETERRAYNPASPGSCQVTIFNPFSNNINVTSEKINEVISGGSLGVFNNVPVGGNNELAVTIQEGLSTYKGVILLNDSTSLTFIYEKGLREINGTNNLMKYSGTRPQLNVVPLKDEKLIFNDPVLRSDVELKKYERQVVFINSGVLDVSNASSLIHSKKLAPGGVYLMIVWEEDGKVKAESFNLIDPPSLHIFWILPQFIFQALAESFQYISLMFFLYTQAPPSMRSIMMSFLLIAQACGNLTIASISSLPFPISTQTFISVGLLFCCLMAFIVLAKRYTYQIIRD